MEIMYHSNHLNINVKEIMSLYFMKKILILMEEEHNVLNVLQKALLVKVSFIIAQSVIINCAKIVIFLEMEKDSNL